MSVHGRPRPPILVGVLTGFLGAGKTTLLARLLKAPAMADTAVIINEFGEIGLDHLLVESAGEGVVELAGGCLCCRVAGDLVATLENLLRGRDNDRVMPFRRVVIETTGLADPAPVLQSVMLHPYLAMRYAPGPVVAVVDAVNGMATLDAHEESVRQAAIADTIVVTKTDLVAPSGDGERRALAERLRSLNPSARIVDVAHGEALPERMFDSVSADVAGWLGEVPAAGAGGARDHDHGHDHTGRLSRHDDRIGAFSIREERAISLAGLEGFLDLVRAEHGADLLRVKGLVRIAGEPDRPLVIHGVQHLFHPPVALERWPDEDRSTRMVFIARDVDGGRIAALFDAFVGEEAAVAPGNPLATPGTGPFRA